MKFGSGKVSLRNSAANLGYRGGVLSGIDNLPAALTINGITVYPMLRYKGQDATSTLWQPWGYGEVLSLQAGTAPTYNNGSPLLGPYDDSVKFNAGGYYLGSTSLGDIGTEDFVLELIVNTNRAESSYFIGKLNVGVSWPGWTIYHGNFYLAGLDAAPNSFEFGPTSMLANAWAHLMCFVDRSGKGQWYCNGLASGSESDASSVGSMSNSRPFVIGAKDDGTTNRTDRLAYLAMWKRAAWLDTHLQSTIAAQRFALLTGSRPLISIASATSLAAGGNVGPAYQQRITSGVSRLHYMGAGSPRFEQRTDAHGRTLTGVLVEAGATLITGHPASDGVGSWDIWQATITADGATAPNGRVSIRVNDNASNNGHSSYFTCAPALNDVIVVQCIAKAGTKDYIALTTGRYDGETRETRQFFNLSTGALGTYLSSADWTKSLASMTPMGDGWHRCVLVLTDIVGGSMVVAVEIVNADGGLSYLGDGTGTIYWSGFNLTLGEDHPTSPVYTAAGTVTRAADSPHRISGSHFGNSEGCLFFRFLSPTFTPTRNHHLWTAYQMGSAATDSLQCWVNTSGNLVVRSTVGSVTKGQVTYASNLCDNVIHECCIVWRNGYLSVRVDNVWSTPDLTNVVPASMDTLDCGTSDSASSHAGPILVGDFSIYPHVENNIINPFKTWCRG